MPVMYGNIEDRINNIVDERDLKQVTVQVLEQITDVIGKTLGPYGGNILINEPQVGHFMTKDGFTVMNNVAFQGELAKIIHELIRGVSRKLVEKVGDASTTSVISANKLYNSTMNLIEKYNIRPKEAMDILENLRDVCIKHINASAKKVSPDLHELVDIATISINNDEKLGRIVAEAYQKTNGEGFVNVKLGKGENTTISEVNGFQIDYGYVDPILINNPELKESAYDNPWVLMFDAGLHDEKWTAILNYIAATALKEKQPIIIITSSYGKLIKNWFANFALSCKNAKAPIPVSLISMPNTTESQFATFEDLAIKLGAKIINTLDKEEDTIDFLQSEIKIGDIVSLPISTESKTPFLAYVGKCNRIVSTEKTTTFIGSQGDDMMIKSRIQEIKTNLENSVAEDALASTKYRLKKRLAVLTDKLVTINIGGISEQSKLSDKALIDDAVGACKATLKHGFVRGNNTELMAALYEYLTNGNDMFSNVQKEFAVALFSSVYEPYRIVRKNAKIETDEINTLEEVETKAPKIFESNLNIIKGSNIKVISPTNTDIEIIKSITSIIGLLITCKAAITKDFNSNYVETREI